jgi:hypothetical protein
MIVAKVNRSKSGIVESVEVQAGNICPPKTDIRAGLKPWESTKKHNKKK